MGNGVYLTGNSLRVFTSGIQFDSEAYNDDRTSWTRPSRYVQSSARTTSWKSVESAAIEAQAPSIRDGWSEAHAAVVEEEEAYHVFNKKQKWVVVVIIGVAGLFSGLSSNIFFPSLDAIAKVSSTFAQPEQIERRVAEDSKAFKPLLEFTHACHR